MARYQINLLSLPEEVPNTIKKIEEKFSLNKKEISKVVEGFIVLGLHSFDKKEFIRVSSKLASAVLVDKSRDKMNINLTFAEGSELANFFEKLEKTKIRMSMLHALCYRGFNLFSFFKGKILNDKEKELVYFSGLYLLMEELGRKTSINMSRFDQKDTLDLAHKAPPKLDQKDTLDLAHKAPPKLDQKDTLDLDHKALPKSDQKDILDLDHKASPKLDQKDTLERNHTDTGFKNNRPKSRFKHSSLG